VSCGGDTFRGREKNEKQLFAHNGPVLATERGPPKPLASGPEEKSRPALHRTGRDRGWSQTRAHCGMRAGAGRLCQGSTVQEDLSNPGAVVARRERLILKALQVTPKGKDQFPPQPSGK